MTTPFLLNRLMQRRLIRPVLPLRFMALLALLISLGWYLHQYTRLLGAPR